MEDLSDYVRKNLSPNWEKKEPPRTRTDKEKAYWKVVPEAESSDILTRPLHLKHYIDRELNEATGGFVYTEANKALLNCLVWITLDNQYELTRSQFKNNEGASVNKLDVSKGVLVFGGYGTGKTTICRVFAKLWEHKQTSCIKVIQEHPKWGKYETGSWYFDDLGAEMEPMYSKPGSLKAISALLETRYFNRQRTIVTTNLVPAEIREQYGARMEDRIHEQFNIFSLLGNSHRRK